MQTTYSPRSSNGARSSHHSSPGTPPTVYSPNDVRASGASPANARGAAQGQASSVDDLIGELGKFDPFSGYGPGDDGTAGLGISLQGDFPLTEPIHKAFTTDFASNDRAHYWTRYLVAQCEGDLTMTDVDYAVKTYACFYDAIPIQKAGRIARIKFDDLRMSLEASKLLTELGFAVHFATPRDIAMIRLNEYDPLEDYEGQVVVYIKQNGAYKDDYRQEWDELVKHYARSFGAVKHMSPGMDAGSGFWGWRIEFYSANAAVRSAFGCGFFLQPYLPGATQLLGEMLPFNYHDANGQVIDVDNTFHLYCANMYLPVGVARRSYLPDRTNHGAMHQSHMVRGYALNPNAAYATSCMNPWDHHNQVDPARVFRGADVRTTIMLRNIPNKMDWASLKNLLDRVCLGLYDFLYLRIDFSTGSNVGYAFVNFVNTRGLMRMIEKIEKKPWKGYRSNKSAEISYATIQGKEALISKFRNSSVMMEAPYCKPRIFYSVLDTDPARATFIGTEMAFPEPDNPAKLQRSVDNARNVGLFPPHGAQGGNDHRERNSMYDRGTPRDTIMSQANRAHHPGYDQLPDWVKERFVNMQATQTGRQLAWHQLSNDFLGRVLGTPSNNHMAVVGNGYGHGPIGAPVPMLPMTPNTNNSNRRQRGNQSGINYTPQDARSGIFQPKRI